MATIFTKIIKGEIPSYKIAEDERHYAFLDINPIAKGHTLVVPKQETDYFFDLSEQELNRAMDFSRHIAQAIDQALQPLRTGIIVQGLEVPHAHIHLIPLYEVHQEMSLNHKVNVPEEQMQQLAQQISAEVQL